MGYKELFFFIYYKSGEALEQVGQRCGGCPVPGDSKGQAVRGSVQPDLAADVPVHCREIGLDGL